MPNAETLVAKDQIRNLLANHSRGVDRADANLLGSTYHSDAHVDYGFFRGPAATLVEILSGAQKGALPSLHRTANCDIRISGDQATSESYVIAYAEQSDMQRMVFGRYLDRHERRDGDWRIKSRTYVLDSNTNRPNSALRIDPPLTNDHFVPEGGKGASDPGRALLAQHQAATRILQKVTPMNADRAALDAALSRDAIRTLLTGYCRGVDRGDEDLIASLFWEDANVVSGVSNGTGAAFAREVVTYVRSNLESCFHSIANEWIEVTGDHAVGEHYILAHHRAGSTETLTGGRYIDSYERRSGVWKFRARTFVCDWTSTHPVTFETAGYYETLTTRGCFGKSDPIYEHWAGR